ncbi:MFS transporter [Roseovarius sp. SYSU LYC5161]|uniref:MFS transporter n=1 Tax=Roseovarius halophilus (ex Wu et al. 2025) TaxID=3376060 RepID=UPI00399AC55E
MALTTGQKAGWGLADLGVVVFVVVKQLLVLAFLTSYLGVPAAIAGAATTGVLVFDMITDPVIGYLSDRTDSRYGRRAPWMVIGAMVMVVGMVGLFAVPRGMDGVAALPWVLGFFCLATLGFTMVAIPYGALAGEITEDGRDRSQMMAWRMGFASLGLLLGGALVPALAAEGGHARAALVVAPLILGAIWFSVWSIRTAPRHPAPVVITPWQMLAQVLGNAPFMVLAALYGVMTLAVALITAGLPFAALYLISDTGDTPLSGAAQALTVLSLLFAAFTLGAILSQAGWVLASARLGKLGALVLGLCLYVALLVGLYAALPAVNVTVIAGLFVLAGMTNGAYQQIPWAMYPDLMDATRARTGLAIEGGFSAIWLFGQKLANALAPGALGLILGAFGWRETTQGLIAQEAAALEALHVSVTLIPAGILALAVLGLWGVYRPLAARASARA